MADLFEREQRILDNAIKHMNDAQGGIPCDGTEFKLLVKEYGRLLKQLRRVTKLSDRTTVDLNTSKLDLLDKVHYDALTGIYNRRFMEDTLKRLISSLSRSNGILSVLMIDIDYFKLYNDTYGHGEGDICLKRVAKTLGECVARADDFVARYGGEEFTVVLPNTDAAGTLAVANKILTNIRELNIPHEKSEAANCVTLSIGGTTSRDVKHIHRGEIYIRRADEALYLSKKNGRNRYTFLETEEDL